MPFYLCKGNCCKGQKPFSCLCWLHPLCTMWYITSLLNILYAVRVCLGLCRADSQEPKTLEAQTWHKTQAKAAKTGIDECVGWRTWRGSVSRRSKGLWCVQGCKRDCLFLGCLFLRLSLSLVSLRVLAWCVSNWKDSFFIQCTGIRRQHSQQLKTRSPSYKRKDCQALLASSFVQYVVK